MKYILASFLFFSVTAQAQPTTMLSNQLDSLFSTYFKASEPGGAVLLVKDNRVVWKKSYGFADINTNEKITTNTLFNVKFIICLHILRAYPIVAK